MTKTSKPRATSQTAKTATKARSRKPASAASQKSTTTASRKTTTTANRKPTNARSQKSTNASGRKPATAAKRSPRVPRQQRTRRSRQLGGPEQLRAAGLHGVAGLDLGDKHSQLCWVDLETGEVQSQRVRTSRAALTRFFAPRPRLRVVFEAGTHANWVYRLLEQLGHEPLMADTHRLALITQSLSKDDQKDAEKLMDLGLRNPELLHPVEPRSLQTQLDRVTLRAREALVETRTKLINHVRGTAKSFGYRLGSSSGEAFATMAQQQLPAELRPMLDPVLLQIAHATAQLKVYQQQIDQLCQKYEATKWMRTVQGVGPLTALQMVLQLDNDPARLSHSRQAGAWVGLRPKRRDSGERSLELRVTKRGDPLTRRLLVQSAQYILGHFGEDSALRRWGLQLAARGGRSAKRKAIVAVARKLAVILHVLWRRQENFQPFPATETAAG